MKKLKVKDNIEIVVSLFLIILIEVIYIANYVNNKPTFSYVLGVILFDCLIGAALLRAIIKQIEQEVDDELGLIRVSNGQD